MGNPMMWFPNRSDTNRPVQLQKKAISMKFWIKPEEELYYPWNENKGADQLRGYREAGLRLLFSHDAYCLFSAKEVHFFEKVTNVLPTKN